MSSADPFTAAEVALTETEHQKYRQIHKQYYVDTTMAADRPLVIILAGQPGSGKSALKTDAGRSFLKDARPVVVDVDILRESHPSYVALKKQNDRTAAGKVQEDAGRWADELVSDARVARRNVVIDGTLKSPDKAEALCRTFKQAGYRVEVRAMAVRHEDSVLGVYRRFEAQKAIGKNGRWVDLEVHDSAYEGLPASIDCLNRSDYVDKIEIYGRSPSREKGVQQLYSAPPRNGDPVEVLLTERSRNREPHERQWYLSEAEKVVGQIEKRDPNLLEPENREFVERLRAREEQAPDPEVTTRADAGNRSVDDPARIQSDTDSRLMVGRGRELRQSVLDRWAAAESAVPGAVANVKTDGHPTRLSSTAERWNAVDEKSEPSNREVSRD
ncbi:MAG: zeta toxin family protein [Limnobacter sp.]|uniref:zeta toxin family protein n=1 Tax=Limnobacter sp. TaxID=2003368 RepID=UPI0022C08097|nr:zeta toxin family protein [Limnobacter sp.]MCZ8017224.1 zeta toxin family protein [Limnobacter sp.]MCZ8081538.1 zeta toxin family protein [Paracoccaceae bacterium]